ncbi:MAG: A/G-specific adenine glycosylase [Alphaproteobacteria bacterium]
MATQRETSVRFEPAQIAPAVLDWYDRHRRRLPWRALPGERADPYRVWLSEIMLQQTTVATVKERFDLFIDRWPGINDLARAPLDDVLHAWAGLGYYARARNLHKCAIAVSTEFGGAFPNTEETLRQLPGIGDYTAAAIAAIAFDRPANVVDGNIERVIARLFGVSEPLPGGKKPIRDAAASCAPTDRPGDYAQAMMDLGATVCSPKSPKCTVCPLVSLCAGRPVAESLPARAPKKQKPVRRGVAFWLEKPDGSILFRRRAETGLLGGMMEVPSSDWIENGPIAVEDGIVPPVPVRRLTESPGLVRHTFTHFHLEIGLTRGRVDSGVSAPDTCVWITPDQFGDLALPTVMKKVVELAMKG